MTPPLDTLDSSQTANTSRPSLESPLRLPCGVVLKNRLLKSAMSEALGTRDNRMTEALPTLYDRWSRSGTGVLVTGNVMIDPKAVSEPGNVVLEDERDMELLRRWAEKGSQNGTALWMQLNHPGKQVMRGMNREGVSPSAVPFEPRLRAYFPTPRALEAAEIEALVTRFATSAKLAQRAGFGGVQIHGAHGYLVSQFLSPHHNRRDDAWGGTPEKRMRFVLEVYRAMRAEVGESFPISIKLNSADFQKGGFSEEESLDVCSALSESGIDLIEISGGTYERPAMALGAGEPQKESTKKREAYFLDFAAKARTRVRVPLAVTGGFRTRQGIDEALESGALDVVGLARSLVLDPDFSNKLLARQDVVSLVRPIRTGIWLVDKAGLMEVAYYERQLHRMGHGKEPKARENALLVLIATLWRQGLGPLFQKRRA